MENFKKGLLVTAAVGIGLVGAFSLNANANTTYEQDELAYEAKYDYISKRIDVDSETWQVTDSNGTIIDAGTFDEQNKLFGSFSMTTDDGNILDFESKSFETQAELEAWQAEIDATITEFLESQPADTDDIVNFSGIIVHDVDGDISSSDIMSFETQAEFDAWQSEFLESQQISNIY